MDHSLELIARKILYKPKPTDVPVIHCRRNFAHVMTCDQFDKSWEGLKIVTENGRPTQQIDHNHVVVLHFPDGVCEIPDTKNNRARLDRVSKPRYEKVTTMVHDMVSGKDVPQEETILIQPPYEILEENMISDKLARAVAEQILKIQEERKADAMQVMVAETGTDDERPAPPEESSAPSVVTGAAVARTTRRRNTGKSLKAQVSVVV